MMRLIQEGHDVKIRLGYHEVANVEQRGYPLERQVRLDVKRENSVEWQRSG
jgi:hypothetical protein